jgi:hypothetical protein
MVCSLGESQHLKFYQSPSPEPPKPSLFSSGLASEEVIDLTIGSDNDNGNDDGIKRESPERGEASTLANAVSADRLRVSNEALDTLKILQ